MPDVRDSLTSSLVQPCLTLFSSLVPAIEESIKADDKPGQLSCAGLAPDLNGEEDGGGGCAAVVQYYSVHTSLPGANDLTPAPQNPLVTHLPDT